MADAHSPEEMKKHVMLYVYIGALLLLLTGVTVLVSYLDLPTAGAVYIGVAIACIKGFFVAGYFMHLLDEKKIIYSTLGLTVILFIPLLLVPWFVDWNSFGTHAAAMEIPAPAETHDAHGH